MTPIQPLGSAGPVSELQPEEAPVCRLPDPSLNVCRADTFSTATPPEPSRLEKFHSRYAQQVFRSNLLKDAFPRGSSAASSPALGDPADLSLWAAFSVLSNVACTAHPPIPENGGGGPIGNPDPDRPKQNPNGADGGLGVGINTAFATGICVRPLDLDPSNTAGSALMTCGVNGLTGNSTGISVVERIDAGSGLVNVLLQLPTTLGGDANRPVFTTASASGSNGVVYTGFAPRNTPTELQSNSALFSNSGVFTWNEANSAVVPTTFDPMQIKLAGTILPISLETHQTVLSIRPNGPVSMVRVGDHLFVLSENRALNPGDNRMTNAPATVHRYSIAADGKLTPAPVTGVQPGNVIFGTNTQTNAILLDGMYIGTAIGDVGDGRIAMVIQGSTDGSNRSSLVVNTTDFGPGFNVDPAHPDDPVPSTIPLIDANKPGAPDFAVNDSTQVSIVGIGGVPHALVGSSDGSGRIAVVNLDKNPVANRVRFINVFDSDNDGFADDGGNIANIVTRPGSFAYVISDTGKARAVTLDTGTSFGAVGKVYSITSSAPAAGTQLPSLFVGNSILVAQPGGYSKAPLN